MGLQPLYNTVRKAVITPPHFGPATLAAAVGSGLAVEEPRGRMVIDWGSGLTEIAVLSLGGICVARSIRLGGDSLDAAVQDHLTSHHRFQIGRATAERFKLQLSERSEEHTSELQSLMRISYAVFCLKKKKNKKTYPSNSSHP